MRDPMANWNRRKKLFQVTTCRSLQIASGGLQSASHRQPISEQSATYQVASLVYGDLTVYSQCRFYPLLFPRFSTESHHPVGLQCPNGEKTASLIRGHVSMLPKYLFSKWRPHFLVKSRASFSVLPRQWSYNREDLSWGQTPSLREWTAETVSNHIDILRVYQ